MPPAKKPDTSGYRTLKKQLEDHCLTNLYLFHGEETYLKAHYLQAVKQALLDPAMAQFNLHEITQKDFSPQQLEQVIDCLPMMAEKTLILLHDVDLFGANEADRGFLCDLLSDLPSYCCVIFLYDQIPFKMDGRSKLAACVKEHGVIVDFVRQTQTDLADWIRRRFRAHDKEIDRQCCLDLIFLCGDLMTNLIQEIDKIAAFASEKKISSHDIHAVATPQLDAVIFQMTDYIGNKNFEKALVVFHNLLQMQEPPLKILWQLSQKMRQIYSAKLALQAGKDAAFLAKLWSIHPYPAEKIMHAARLFSLPWCRNAVILCAETDKLLKSYYQDETALLTSLLLRLAAPVTGDVPC